MNEIGLPVPAVDIGMPPEKRVWGAGATAGFGAAVIVVFIVAQALAAGIPLLVMAFSRISPSTGTPPDEIVEQVMDLFNANMGLLQSIATIAAGIIGTGLILIIIKTRKGAGIAEYLGLNRISVRAILLSIGLVILFIVATDGIQILLGKEASEQIMYDVYGTSVWPPLFWIAVIIFAPLFEETFFRGFLFEGFRQSRLGAAGAIVITAGIFALMHTFQYNVFNVIWILMLGLLMGAVRWKTKTLWSTFIMHATVNLIATIQMALDLSEYVS